MKVCSFTGHRPQNLPFGFREEDERCLDLKHRLREEIEKQILSGTEVFLTGMAQGVDTYAAEIVLQLKKEKYPQIVLNAILPCEGQSTKWSREAQVRYMKTLQGCKHCYVMSREYTPECMHRRNRFLVEHADEIIAVWDGSPGGTANTVHYAEKLGKTIIRLFP